jgi:hypothetical protein
MAGGFDVSAELAPRTNAEHNPLGIPARAQKVPQKSRKDSRPVRMSPGSTFPLRWHRTSFTRIDGAIEVSPDDWVLEEPGRSYGRIYRITGGPKNDRWFWAAYLHTADGHPFNGGIGDAADGRGAREEVERRQPEEVRARISGAHDRAE